MLARIAGVADRDAAEALKGVRLYVDREALPPADADEYYHADLIGLRAEMTDGTALGTRRRGRGLRRRRRARGARAEGGSVMLPFTRAVVPVVDLAGGRVVIDPPPGLLAPPTMDGRTRGRAPRRA